MRSCRAKHNGFVLWEPKGALCLLTVNPQNGAGQVGGGTIRAKLDGHRSAIAKGGWPGSKGGVGLFPFSIALLCFHTGKGWMW